MYYKKKNMSPKWKRLFDKFMKYKEAPKEAFFLIFKNRKRMKCKQ